LFCSKRSFASATLRLLSDDELTEPEQKREAELYHELLTLRERVHTAEGSASPAAQPGQHTSSIWRFPDGEAVSIVCSEAPDPPAYANLSHLNYSRYARHIHLDTLIDIFGQVRADNPTSMIRILAPEELTQDFGLNHLVIIGDAALYYIAPYFAPDIPLPQAAAVLNGENHFFNCQVNGESRKFTSSRDDDGALVEDVGLIARGPHPYVHRRTVTVISGITSRGVHGAAMCFTDSHVRVTNEQYLESKLGSSDAFCLLINIPVRNHVALPPNLWRDGTRLYEWSAETGARW
jgi:hypothetical protein